MEDEELEDEEFEEDPELAEMLEGDPDEEDEGDEGDEEDEESNGMPSLHSPEEKAIKKLEEMPVELKKHTNVLNLGAVRLATSFWPFKNAKEMVAYEKGNDILKKNKQINNLLRTASKHYKKRVDAAKGQLKKEIQAFKEARKNYNKALFEAKKRFAHKMLSWLSSSLVVIFKILLIVGIAVLVVVAVSFVLSVFSDDDIRANGMTSPMGATGEHFYGVRLIYEDKENEVNQLKTDYGAIVTEVVEFIETQNATLTLDVKIENEENVENLNALTKVVADYVYVQDNGGTAPEDDTVYAGIKYFGILEGWHEDIVDAIWTTVSGDAKYYSIPEGGNIASANISNAKSVLADDIVRTEKLFVEDQLFTKEDDCLHIKAEKNYKAMLFFPKVDCVMDNLIINAHFIDKETFKVYYQIRGEEAVEITRDVSLSDVALYGKYSGEIELEAFPVAPEKANGSLAEIGKQEYRWSYLEQYYDENGEAVVGVYTYVNPGIMVLFDSTTPFMFSHITDIDE